MTKRRLLHELHNELAWCDFAWRLKVFDIFPFAMTLRTQGASCLVLLVVISHVEDVPVYDFCQNEDLQCVEKIAMIYTVFCKESTALVSYLSSAYVNTCP